jgi:hypothetical protein
MPDKSSAERAVVRFALNYQKGWLDRFPKLFKRSQWNAAMYLCSKRRHSGVLFVELHSACGQPYWLNEATMKEHVAELADHGLCTLTPRVSEARLIASSTMVAPTAILLDRFGQHISDFVQRICAEAEAIAGAQRLTPPFAMIDHPQKMTILLRALQQYREPWNDAVDLILDAYRDRGGRPLLGPRLEAAKRKLMRTSYWILLHVAVERHYVRVCGDAESAGLAPEEFALELLQRADQASSTTQHQIRELEGLGFLSRMEGAERRCWRLSDAAAEHLRAALAQTAAELPGLIGRLAAFQPPCDPTGVDSLKSQGTSGRLGEQTSKVGRNVQSVSPLYLGDYPPEKARAELEIPLLELRQSAFGKIGSTPPENQN